MEPTPEPQQNVPHDEIYVYVKEGPVGSQVCGCDENRDHFNIRD